MKYLRILPGTPWTWCWGSGYTGKPQSLESGWEIPWNMTISANQKSMSRTINLPLSLYCGVPVEESGESGIPSLDAMPTRSLVYRVPIQEGSIEFAKRLKSSGDRIFGGYRQRLPVPVICTTILPIFWHEEDASLLCSWASEILDRPLAWEPSIFSASWEIQSGKEQDTHWMQGYQEACQIATPPSYQHSMLEQVFGITWILQIED